jgi:hypothetical protein
MQTEYAKVSWTAANSPVAISPDGKTVALGTGGGGALGYCEKSLPANHQKRGQGYGTIISDDGRSLTTITGRTRLAPSPTWTCKGTYYWMRNEDLKLLVLLPGYRGLRLHWGRIGLHSRGSVVQSFSLPGLVARCSYVYVLRGGMTHTGDET